MSSSKPETALFTVDDPEILETKIKNTFTGGQPTVTLQRKLGGNANICPVYWYLNYLFDSEKESQERYDDCPSGNLLCGECKGDMIKKVKPFIKDTQIKREKAHNLIKDFMIDGKEFFEDDNIGFDWPLSLNSSWILNSFVKILYEAEKLTSIFALQKDNTLFVSNIVRIIDNEVIVD